MERLAQRVDCPGLSNKCHWYILEPGKGFAFHSWDFVTGYAIGWCSLNDPHAEFDADESTFDCDEVRILMEDNSHIAKVIRNEITICDENQDSQPVT